MSTFFEQFKADNPVAPEPVADVDDGEDDDPGTAMAVLIPAHAEELGPEECEVPK